MAAEAIIKAAAELGKSAFDFFGKKQDGKNLKQVEDNLKQEGLNDTFQVFENRFPTTIADYGQKNLLYGLFGVIIVLILAIVIVKIQLPQKTG